MSNVNNTYALLLPCYNAEKFVDGFLANIQKLTKKFDEIIFYDDASTDRTLELIRARGYTVISGADNSGPGYARNRLAEAATGSYIHFHDIDDELLPDYLLKTSVVAETGRFDAILCNVDWIEPQSRNVVLSWQYSDQQIQQSPLEYIIGHPIGGINGLYKRDVFLKSGGFNESYRTWEDADMHVRLAWHGARFCVLEEVLSVSLRHQQSASANQQQAWLNRLQMLEQYAQEFQEDEVREVIGSEAQRAASFLVMSQNMPAATQALQLSEHCKVKVPNNRNPAWSILKSILPAALRIRLRVAQLKYAFK